MITSKAFSDLFNLPIGQYFRPRRMRKPSGEIFQLIRIDEPEDSDAVWITKRVASYWYYEKVWRPDTGSREDEHNEYDQVHLIDELPPFDVKMELD